MSYESFMKDQFPTLLACAQHQDRINSWPWYGRLAHKIFCSWRCPACIEWRKK